MSIFGITTEPATVRTHHWMLRELVRNLLHNAIRHVPVASVLGVRLCQEAQHVTLTVSDAGGGIDSELATRLFLHFSAGDVRGDAAWDLPFVMNQRGSGRRNQPD